MEEPGGNIPLDAAIQRLDQAMALLESRVAGALRDARDRAGGLFDQDRPDLAAELDAARAREQALKAAGAEASNALGRAIAEIRTALGEERAVAVMNQEA